jgi:hypothetical protein
MESIQLCSKSFCRCTKRVVGNMGVTLCCHGISVTEKATDYLKAESTRNKMGSVGMAIVVQTVLGDACLFDHSLPELLNVLKGPSYRISRKQILCLLQPLVDYSRVREHFGWSPLPM